MRDIAHYANVSYSALKYIIKDYEKSKMIVQTRTVGKAKMYKLNLNNPVVEKFIDFYWAVIESGTRQFNKIQNGHADAVESAS